MKDNYIKSKAEEISKLVNTEIQMKTEWSDIVNKVSTMLKEVVRDQVYKSVEVTERWNDIYTNYPLDKDDLDRLCSEVQNGRLG